MSANSFVVMEGRANTDGALRSLAYNLLSFQLDTKLWR